LTKYQPILFSTPELGLFLAEKRAWIRAEYYEFFGKFKSKILSFVGRGVSMEKSGIVYECMRCGSRVPSEELELRGGETKCIICGYRILKKVKPPVVKRVQSR
jgi:DNA-directed RNA polymerase subunit RPC12/RpoP